ncbi:hypothetical protein SODALDRAFT_152963 [Sodiomyces alkalinus F11]|uniref:Uncharacterized protein n=1 Tax=Sodiomyces alkalinus (strain CBS 110278 / VKM F-3762 / F11) TaxID=1314773 RepID=A0A3N2PXA2_SODAK|nr:hypothetical protein SODALDRAFT_152963 [Sodiomyces alkalinus F11]ROT39141.1 hypothetical protein SODALDRAFT_152963 [Sodiomyces alkalinus F11]
MELQKPSGRKPHQVAIWARLSDLAIDYRWHSCPTSNSRRQLTLAQLVLGSMSYGREIDWRHLGHAARSAHYPIFSRVVSDKDSQPESYRNFVKKLSVLWHSILAEYTDQKLTVDTNYGGENFRVLCSQRPSLAESYHGHTAQYLQIQEEDIKESK